MTRFVRTQGVWSIKPDDSGGGIDVAREIECYPPHPAIEKAS